MNKEDEAAVIEFWLLVGGHDAQGQPLERVPLGFDVEFKDYDQDHLIFEWEDNRQFLVKKADLARLIQWVGLNIRQAEEGGA